MVDFDGLCAKKTILDRIIYICPLFLIFVKIFVLSSGSLLGHHLLFFFLLLLIKSWSEKKKKKERKGYVYEKYVMVVALQVAAGSDGPNKGRKQDENDLLAPEQTKKKREHRPVKTTCRRGA
jgi:hypothetical protein